MERKSSVAIACACWLVTAGPLLADSINPDLVEFRQERRQGLADSGISSNPQGGSQPYIHLPNVGGNDTVRSHAAPPPVSQSLGSSAELTGTSGASGGFNTSLTSGGANIFSSQPPVSISPNDNQLTFNSSGSSNSPPPNPILPGSISQTQVSVGQIPPISGGQGNSTGTTSATTPEPTTVVLVASGLLGMALKARRRARVH
jgi:hypothetical protein